MARIVPIAYYTGATPSGYSKFGNLLVGDPSQDYTLQPEGVRWWSSADVETYYVIGHENVNSDQPNPLSVPDVRVGFWRTDKTDAAFIDRVEYISNIDGDPQTFISAADARIWLNNNGYWTSYPESKRVLFLGDTGVNTIANNISTYITNTGYSITYSAVTMGTTYTGGSDITPDNYDVVVMYTNGGQTGGAGLSTNLVNYINAGGNVVTGVFLWNVYRSGFAVSTISAFDVTNSQGHPPGGNIIITSPTVITNGIGLTMPTVFYNNNPTLVSGAVQLATYSNGDNLLATKSVGSSRLVSINAAPLNISNSTSTICKMFGNSILYAAGEI